MALVHTNSTLVETFWAKMIVYLTFLLLLDVLAYCSAELPYCNTDICTDTGFELWLERNKTVDLDPNKIDEAYRTWEFNCNECYHKYYEGLHSKNSSLRFSVALNIFAIMQEDDLVKFTIDNNIDLVENWQQCGTDIPPMNGEIPDSINWVEKGAVTPVKAQNNCSSDWAFTAVGVMEAYRVIKFNETLTALSAQNLIDCTKNFGNDGCYGGDVINALKYVQEDGINPDSTYPYMAKGTNECLFEKNNSVEILAQDYRCVTEGDENQLKAVVANFGPVVVYVDARRWNFHFYHSGIYYDDNCCYHKRCLNHAMLLVGYGTEQGVDYWLLKNSWGESWGEQGYIRIARNLNNTCGVATAALYLV